MAHVNHILDSVIDVPLARFKGGGVRLTDHRLGETPLILINYEVSRGPFLTPENLALQHSPSVPHS